MFHFYSLHVKSQVEKIKRTEEAMKSLEENGDTIANNPSVSVNFCKLFAVWKVWYTLKWYLYFKFIVITLWF